MWLSDIARNLGALFQYDPENVMLFNSGAFLTLFTAFIFIYALIYRNVRARLLYVIAFSLFFYYKASGAYLLILLFSIVLDYGLAFLIDGARSQSQKKLWLTLSICANVGLLCYFKYTNFFLQNINSIFSADFDMLDLFLPIGISFYTFQTLSYIIDVYKGVIKPVRSLLDYTFYMSFFPHLVAGPIVRARDFLPQVRQELNIRPENIGEGFYLIIKGLIKKAIIADYISQYADLVFANPGGYSGFENLMAVYAYTLQIYCDFSGYSDMAIGLALWMGYRLGDNFNTPYVSKSITEFWRRWHISLSSWLRDYVYIPMGGNRKGPALQYVFLMLTMLIGGFWHGASWKFVAWGGLHGLALAVHKLYTKQIGSRLAPSLWRDAIGWFLTFHLAAFLWVFFRAESFTVASEVYKQVFTNMDLAYLQPFWKVRSLFCIMLLAGYAIQFLPEHLKGLYRRGLERLPAPAQAIMLLIVIELILGLQNEEVRPFIYFQF